MYELELFAGAGGGILGKNLLGFRTVGAVEILPYCRRILLQRQKDDCCPMFPIWDDIRTFSISNPDCREYFEWLRSIADKLCISGGFPCQDISSCGKGEGISGKKSSLWLEMARVIREVQPAYVFAENSPLLACRGLEVVLASLAEMGYDAKWCVLGAGHLGYPTKRERLWLLGRHHMHHGKRHDAQQGSAAHPAVKVWSSEKFGALQNVDCNRMLADGFFARTPDGVADWMDRVKAIGNGQVPAVAAIAWQILNGELTTK
nr:MAG TPA: Cytosine specific methyltransferase [Caudoviricetes sp.]